MRNILSRVRKAVEEFNMIKKGEKITVGISGGKDSVLLLLALDQLSRFYTNDFKVQGITIDLGMEGMDFSPLEKLFDSKSIEYYIVKTDIKKIVFDERKEKSPCSLCSKMRNGSLHDSMIKTGSRKIALGHHFDDVVETYFMSLLFESRMNTFSPVTYLDRKDVTMIRPLIYTRESLIESYIERENIPVVTSKCPVDKITKREDIKNLLHHIKDDEGYTDIYDKVFGAIKRSQLKGWS